MFLHTKKTIQSYFTVVWVVTEVSLDQEEQVTCPGLEELSPEMDRKIIENRGVKERPKASPSLLRWLKMQAIMKEETYLEGSTEKMARSACTF